MEVKFTEKGRAAGNISIRQTLETMQPGETWIVGRDNPIANVRVYCSRFDQINGTRFNVTRSPEGEVIVTRKI